MGVLYNPGFKGVTCGFVFLCEVGEDGGVLQPNELVSGHTLNDIV